MYRYTAIAVAAALVLTSFVNAQGGASLPAGVAASVNGTPIQQAALDRALEKFSEADREKASTEILDFLIENSLIDQYLVQQNIAVDQKEIDNRLTELKNDIVKSKQTFEGVLKSLKMSESDFVTMVANDLRWEKFAQAQATDANMKALFEKHMDMFDGSQVRARHILLNPGADPKAQGEAKATLLAIRKEIETRAAATAGKMPSTADALSREQERQKQTKIAFMEYAASKSVCPSKKDGGDLNWFFRVGHMVEPFAAAAFALKPYEMSQPVQTQYGYHLILCTGRKPGQEVKFEDVKEAVKEIYCNRLREAVAAHMKQSAKIVIAPRK